MFEIELLKSLLGKPVTEMKLVNELMLAGKLPMLSEGIFDEYVERPDNGYALIFTDEAMFLAKGTQQIGQGPLYFTCIFFYAGGEDGYTQYGGNLPEGITFSDMREEVVEKLGRASFQRFRENQSILGERWVRTDYSLSVTYSKATNKPTIVSFFKPCQLN